MNKGAQNPDQNQLAHSVFIQLLERLDPDAPELKKENLKKLPKKKKELKAKRQSKL